MLQAAVVRDLSRVALSNYCLENWSTLEEIEQAAVDEKQNAATVVWIAGLRLQRPRSVSRMNRTPGAISAASAPLGDAFLQARERLRRRVFDLRRAS